jgi:hypothetical protein
VASFTTLAVASLPHLTMRVPPWFETLQVPVQTTLQMAPCRHVRLLPLPTVAEQLLAPLHVTLADAPAVSVHVAPIAH